MDPSEWELCRQIGVYLYSDSVPRVAVDLRSLLGLKEPQVSPSRPWSPESDPEKTLEGTMAIMTI